MEITVQQSQAHVCKEVCSLSSETASKMTVFSKGFEKILKGAVKIKTKKRSKQYWMLSSFALKLQFYEENIWKQLWNLIDYIDYIFRWKVVYITQYDYSLPLPPHKNQPHYTSLMISACCSVLNIYSEVNISDIKQWLEKEKY